MNYKLFFLMVSGQWSIMNYELINYKLAVHCAIFHSCPDVGRIMFYIFNSIISALRSFFTLVLT